MGIPTNLRVPFMAVAFDSSRAFQGSSVLAYKVLLVGQMLSAGNASASTIYKLSKGTNDARFGIGSELARMGNKFLEGNVFTDVYGFAYADPAESVAAAGSVTITGTASANGEIPLLIDGTRVATTVAEDDTAAEQATAMAAAVNAVSSLPVTAAVDGTTPSKVNFTAKNKGVIGNDIDIRSCYYEGEVLPAGVTLSITAMASGTGSIDLATVIAALGTEWYQVICCSAVDASNLTKIEAELVARFGPLRMKDGVYITARRGVGADKATKNQESINFGNGRNSKHVCCMNASYIPNSPGVYAAAIAAQASYEASVDPARPLQTLELVGILPPAQGQRNDIEDDNALLFDGISTFDVLAGKVTIQRLITMYQLNDAGSPDIAYLNLETMFTLMYLRYDFRTRIRTKFPRAKLAKDGVRVRPGMQVITPNIGKAEAIAIFRSWEEAGLVEGIDQFKRDLDCRRSDSDPDRLEWILPPDLMNQFRVGAVTLQFLLQDTTIA